MYFVDQKIIPIGNLQGTEFWRSWNSKQNIPTDRAQRVGEENGVVCLVIMFGFGVMVIKMLKKAHFLYSLLMPAEN